MISEDEEEKFDAAAEVVEELLREFISLTGLPLSDLFRSSFERLLIAFHPNIKTLILPTGGVAYEVDDRTGFLLTSYALGEQEIALAVREICASNVFEGYPLPPSLRKTAFSMIHGTFPAKQRRGPARSSDFSRRWILRWCAQYVSDAFDLNLTRNDASSSEISACDVVSLVATKLGEDVSFRTLRDWCAHHKHSGFRKRADLLTNFLKDMQLIELGVLSGKSVCEPLTTMVRMRG
ncbi:hypothetical protein B6V72_09645 [Thioclava sp. F34-6]|uniref:hypothetical protein n=1 Tax=Thioclava sp. F34-6 TaxID=1973003 RepID=UPI000B544E46|nr:hypothetical protein [Thioclava sp. F34-6]OWY13060.1 hypothetical protein B6V72_09645 [Thioclava sp. F34-6]